MPARLIVKCRYIQKAANAGGYIQYIATRDGVEKLPESIRMGPAIPQQKVWLEEKLEMLPQVRSTDICKTYEANATVENATALQNYILEYAEDSDEPSSMDGYLSYIATRDGVQRMGEHGLFGDEDNIDLEKAKTDIAEAPGRVWTQIYSLHREDAVRLGYDHAEAWKNLVRNHRNDIATAMHIEPDHLHWYAAYHDKPETAHIHVALWADDGSDYLTPQSVEKIKSCLMNEIFKQDLLSVYERKGVARDELVKQSRATLAELASNVGNGLLRSPELEQQLKMISSSLQGRRGRKQYQYLPKEMKAQVDTAVNLLSDIPEVAECYDKWWKIKSEVDSYYGGQAEEWQPMSERKEFRSVKNAVIRAADTLGTQRITFEDEEPSAQDGVMTPTLAMPQRREAMAEDDIEQKDKAAPDNLPSPEDTENPWLKQQYRFASRYRAARNILYDDFDEPVTQEEIDAAAADLKSLAEEGYSYAQYRLGIVYRDGVGVIPDMVQATYWLTAAANNGNDISAYALGKLMMDEPEVRDTAAAIRQLEAAAAKDNSYAAYRLAKEYLVGTNIPQNTEAGVAYMTQAAEQGNPYAQYQMGKLYLDGELTERDVEMAEHWFTQAAEQGNPYAKFFLAHLDQMNGASPAAAVLQLLRELERMFRDNAPRGNAKMKIDRKRRRELMQKRRALGHKETSLEEYEGPTMSM